MLKNLVKNSFWIAIAFFCAMCTSYSQVYGPTAQNPFPAGSALINIAPDVDRFIYYTMLGVVFLHLVLITNQAPGFRVMALGALGYQ